VLTLKHNPCARALLRLAEYASLPVTRIRGAQRLFTAVGQHAHYLALTLAAHDPATGSERLATHLTSVAQEGCHAFLDAKPCDPLCRLPSADFRPWLQYHLHLPVADSPDPAVRYGDAAINACAHGHRHTLALTAWHHATIAAYGAAVTHREPPDYAEFSPGYRPDLAVEGGGRGGELLLLDTKVGSPYVTSLTAEERHRSTYVPFAGTAERHTTAVLGRAQRGEPGDGPHVFADGSGYVSPKKADYHGALQRAVEVRPIIHETYGGLHRTASRTLREMAGVYATRLAGSAGGRRAGTFRRFHRQRISCALAKGLAFELRHGARVLRARATPGGCV
jgi:hypothetical protein